MVFAETFRVNSPNVVYGETEINAKYSYETVEAITQADGSLVATPKSVKYEFKTQTTIPKVGCLLVGLGGNNGSTAVAGAIANKEGISWMDKEGVKTPNFWGSLTQASTVRVGSDGKGEDVYVPLKGVVPMVSPKDIVFHGWDINKTNLADSMNRAKVLPYDLQRQLAPIMKDIVPMPSIYVPDFIASNQADRADNLLSGSIKEQMDAVRQNIRDFKTDNDLEKVYILWTANTERFAEVAVGLNDTAENLLQSIEAGESEISPSTLFAVASIMEGCPYINGSPQNTFVPGVIDLAQQKNVFIAGDDFKSGQTKIKSVMVDFLISAGLKPTSIVSYNHLGNNDGKNLSAPKQFRSKEISKSNVVDDMVASNRILYKDNEHPDHCVVIKYVPYVGDSKRAMDEYTSEIFMNGKNTIVMHNTCEDSLLAVPIIYDLVILTELMDRITFKEEGETEFTGFNTILSILSFLLKAPLVPEGTPIINAFFKQRSCIENILKACVGLPAENNMLLECKQ
eukprot:TRINITY_DN14_c1_g1_i1.p1 TRINITY_DN14_c1_g1~~TRINITY_DN14_c1_g1_i1.p1  ORF type:complete len:511 (+),score=181.31 TRINITY_DN14_c1_g1_i1:66-1598(+)